MAGTISEDSIVVVSDKQVASEFLDEEIVVLNVQEGAYYVLNPVGARVWSMIHEPQRVGTLIDALLEEYDVQKEQCAHEVTVLLRELAERELVTIRDGDS